MRSVTHTRLTTMAHAFANIKVPNGATRKGLGKTARMVLDGLAAGTGNIRLRTVNANLSFRTAEQLKKQGVLDSPAPGVAMSKHKRGGGG